VSRRRPLGGLLAWLALCGGLAFLVYTEDEQLQQAFAEPARPPPAAAAPAAASAPAGFTLPPLASFSEVVERPLFFEKRRPIEPPPTEAAPVEVGDFLITGIVISDTDRHVLVRVNKNSQTKRVREGETISDWSVEQIHSDRVVLRRGEEVEEMKPRERGQKAAKVSRPVAVRQPAGALPLAAPGLAQNSPPARRPNIAAPRVAPTPPTTPEGRRRR